MDTDTLPTPVALLPAPQSTSTETDRHSWIQEGFDIAHDTNTINWRWCDWWERGEAHGYGTLKAICEMQNWPGPNYRRFQNMLSVSRKIGSRRREGLAFELHALVAPMPPAQQEELLCWAEHQTAMGQHITKASFKQKKLEFKLQHAQEPDEVKVNSTKQLKKLIKRFEWKQEDIDAMQLLIETHKRDIDPEAREEAYKVLRHVRDLSSSFTEDWRDRRSVTQEC